MDHTDLRSLDQRLADHLDQVRGLRERNRTACADRFGEGLRAVDQLGRDPRLVATGAGSLTAAEDLRDPRALHALQLLELAVEALCDAGERDDGGRDDLHRDRGAARLVLGAVDRSGPRSSELVAELELRRQRVPTGGRLGIERDQACSVDGAKVRIVAELLLALRAEFHRRVPVMLRIVKEIREGKQCSAGVSPRRPIDL
jgi:hypothetical protein